MRLLLLSILSFSFLSNADMAMQVPEGSLLRARTYDYATVRNLALRILEDYPPDRYHFVGVGRAPTVLIAMFQAILGQEAARNLPLSGMRHLHPPMKAEPNPDGSLPEIPARLRFEHYTSKNLERFERHLDRFLPESLEDKKLLFLDWGHYGYTLTNLKREFEAMMATRPARTRLTADYLALTDGSNSLPTKLAGRGIRSMVCSPYDRYVIDVLYKHFSEYGQWPVHLDVVGVPKRHTRSELRRRMRHELSTFFMPGVKQDMHFRQSRKDFYKRYRNVRSYDDLVEAYEQRVAKDPYVREFRQRHQLIENATFSRLERLRMKCETALGRHLPI